MMRVRSLGRFDHARRLSARRAAVLGRYTLLFRRPAAAHLHAGVSISTPNEPGLLCGRYPPRLLLENSCRSARRAASDGLIWPKDGCASIACAATAAPRLSSPALTRIPRGPRKSQPRHPPLCSGPETGAAAIAFGLQIAIEAAMVA